jgi:hypothetical protein
MKYIKNFENYRVGKHLGEIIKEAVLQVGDVMRVKTLIDIPQSLINSYVKKVKELSGSNLRSFYSDQDIAEEIIKYITVNNIDVEKIPGNALTGGPQDKAQGQAEIQPQVQPQAQPQAQAQTQPQAQAQPQAQPQAQAQPPAQGQVQVQTEAQPVAQPAAQGQEGFEEPAAPAQGQEEEENDEEENELPVE